MTTNFNRQLDKLRGFMGALIVELCEDMGSVSASYTQYCVYADDSVIKTSNVIKATEAERLKSNVDDLLVSIAQVRELTDGIIQLLSERLFVEYPWLAPDDTEEMADDQSQTDKSADTDLSDSDNAAMGDFGPK